MHPDLLFKAEAAWECLARCCAMASFFFFNQQCASLARIKVQYALTLHVNNAYKADYLWLESRLVSSLLTADLALAMLSFMTLLSERAPPRTLFFLASAIMKVESPQQMSLIMILFPAV